MVLPQCRLLAPPLQPIRAARRWAWLVLPALVAACVADPHAAGDEILVEGSTGAATDLPPDLGDDALDPAAADRPEPDSHRDEVGSLVPAVEAADAVFLGRVVGLEHRSLTDVDFPDSLFPHTFVTYEVLEGFRNAAPGEKVTLRFLGGPNDDETLVMKASGVPDFDLGETDVLLVRDNGASPCPLVGCAAGRLRVVDDVVASADGHAVRLDALGRLSHAERLDLDVVGHHDFFGRDPAPEDQRLDRATLAPRTLEIATLSSALTEIGRTLQADQSAATVSPRGLADLSITPDEPLRARTPRGD